MKPLHAQPQIAPVALAGSLLKLERQGRYSDALDRLKKIWPDTSKRPGLAEMGAAETAEMLLRCGSIYGFYGHNKQVAGAQLMAKDLLSEARELFIGLGNLEKTAECENHLALCYWRTGEMNEARDIIRSALAHDLPLYSDATLYAHVTKSLINNSLGNYPDTIETGRSIEYNVREHGSPFITGSFYTNLGLAYKNLADLSQALECFELARHYHQRSRHKVYLATVENNLAQLYRETGHFAKAHLAIDDATRLFKQVKDRTREGFSLDTKALVFLSENRYSEAMATVDKALAVLRKSENSAYIAETLLTKARIKLYLDDFADAVRTLMEAVDLARIQSGENAATRLINEFEVEMNRKNEVIQPPQLSNGDVELIMPPSLSKYDSCRGVWMTNDHLEAAGLGRGSLAIVVNENVGRGDLAALAEVENGSVVCGYYDADFGLVCLETPAAEPQIFDEKCVRILGRIVGVGRHDPDGKITVEAIDH